MLVAAQLVAVGAGSYVYAWYSNSLEGSGRWSATKAHLEQGVMGALAFAQSSKTLSGERVDLGRWFGFQEVRLREPVAARSLELDFQPSANAYLSLLYAIGPEASEGLRLSSDPLVPAARFRCAASGEFLELQPLPDFTVQGGAWAHLRLDFSAAGVAAALDGRPAIPLGPAPSGPQPFAFRSGVRSVLVDDLRLCCTDGGGFHESFFNWRGFLFALGGLSGLVGLQLFLWRVTRHDRRLRALLVAGGASLVFLALGALALIRIKAGTYPRLDRTAEDAWLAQEVERIDACIHSEHALRAPERTRVLVLGSSQTWGAGATHAGEGFVEVLEQLLRAAAPARDWECVNAGVSGLRAQRLVELLRERWLALEPDVLIVNLSNNDKDPAAFEQALEACARLAAEHGIAALFALEANSSECAPGELPLHPVMRRVAEAHGIPVVDVHRALAAQAGRGFLWWDNVHPTTFGHRLIAETLLPAVLERADT